MLLTTVFAKIGPPPDKQRRRLEYPIEMLAPLMTLGPTSWNRLIYEIYDHAGGTDLRYERLCILAALDQLALTAHSSTWRTLEEAGFVDLQQRCIADKYICGFTREQLASASGSWVSDFIALALGLFMTSIDRWTTLHKSPGDPRCAQGLDMLQYAVVPVFDKLWDVRDPFLLSHAVCTITTDRVYNSLHGCLAALGAMAALTLKESRPIDIANTRIPHVQLIIWMHNSVQKLRNRALENLTEIVCDRDSQWDAFFRSIAQDGVSQEQITASILDDFADENVINYSLFNVASFSIVRDEAHARERLPPPVSSEPQLGAYTLAAARRQICLGSDSEVSAHDILLSMFTIFKRETTAAGSTPDRQIYGFLDLFCQYAMIQITAAAGQRSHGPERLNEVIPWWFPRLSKLDRNDNRAKTVAMRRHLRKSWQNIADELKRKRLPQQDTNWSVFSFLWKKVGSLIPPVSEDTGEAPFGLLQRCGWSECLCSVHKPAHKMHVCKGCWLVAYCGSRCQANDWEKGGHKRHCRRRTA
ncbi:zinc finger MYND domain-containing protein [Phanerochaete sordida]|uniref:Zinc finger MYND domain-containing protein n=1 Tax=Phanerochaete sordida TaxID=48140 RepID=A0A9P3GGF4_9APHY|nr:zinc finger MYND domain-containing protein [Phanerochaete sordida]